VWGSSALGADREAIRRPSGLRIPYPETGFGSVVGSSAEWRSIRQERSVIGDVFSFPNKARALFSSSTANARDVQSFLRPAAVLCANPIWRRDWRKTSFLRRSPMPRGQAWQSKQGNPFQPVYRRILANAPLNPMG